MSLPMIAEVEVNWPPVTCMPSPESPAKRIVTASSSSIGSFVLVIDSFNVVPDITNSILLFFGCDLRSLQGCVSDALSADPDYRIYSTPAPINIHLLGRLLRQGSASGFTLDGRAREIYS